MEQDVIDWSAVTAWFGHIPRFHDAEVVSIEICRDPDPSVIRLYTFRMNPDTDERGYYRLDLHALVTFSVKGISELEIGNWNHQNALLELKVTRCDSGLKLDMEGAYGVDGYLIAESISVTLEPWQAEGTKPDETTTIKSAE
ncbi:Imm50 family immunity protein [Asticcacaulis sp. ZE23SCel15]|uniref:Imm50 family immunity protein n=1 Tax=Asticcacaulis sp. ZE23SCel15 TaxID=3059027 RepID=UPI00265F0E6A|nr:Imm50 family immunity protein [Asticcacaulis sp. ZE23SCel15]WKL57288.1 Imm50 family immunity protein [Asticcacaulis sp. ZE23SCel15]